MKILYVGVEHDAYDPRHGKSFEYRTFYEGLRHFPGVQVLNIPFDRILEVGRKKFNAELLETARREKPDLLFTFMFSDEFEPETLEELKKITTTVAWFADDSWKFWNYSRRWAKHFSWAVTTYSYMPEKYRAAGQPNVIRSQWAANTDFYRPVSVVSEGPDAAFVGGWSQPRARFIFYLEKKEIRIQTFGKGWPRGKISDEDMVRIFGTSKINLGINAAPGFWNENSLGRLLLRHSANRIVPDFHLIQNAESFLHRGTAQIKARLFEIPACGGFLMTSYADDLEKFYELGREIVVYRSAADCAEKIRYYLAHEDERKKIARAGLERTLRDHTYQKRFAEIFRKIGLTR